MLPLAQLASLAGLPICCVLNDSTIPPAPESTVAPTMSAAGDASLAVVSRLIVSPPGSVIDGRPGGGRPPAPATGNPRSSTQPGDRAAPARPPGRVGSSSAFGTPSRSARGRDRRRRSTPSAGNWGRSSTPAREFLPNVPSGRYAPEQGFSHDEAVRTAPDDGLVGGRRTGSLRTGGRRHRRQPRPRPGAHAVPGRTGCPGDHGLPRRSRRGGGRRRPPASVPLVGPPGAAPGRPAAAAGRIEVRRFDLGDLGSVERFAAGLAGETPPRSAVRTTPA